MKFVVVDEEGPGRESGVLCLAQRLREFRDDARAVRDASADTADLYDRGCSMFAV